MAPKLLLSFLLICINLQFSFSQHIDIDKKALSFLASEEKVNLVFTFDNVLFGGKNITEEEFLQIEFLKISESKGEEVANDWLTVYKNNKEEIWQETFATTLNEKLSNYENSPEFILDDETSKYTMKVNVDWMYFGYNVVIGKEPSKVNMELTFYETVKPRDTIFTTQIRRAMGLNNDSYNFNDWPSIRRMEKAYTKAAYKLAQALKRIVD